MKPLSLFSQNFGVENVCLCKYWNTVYGSKALDFIVGEKPRSGASYYLAGKDRW